MKKIIAIILVVILSLAIFIGCSKQKKNLDDESSNISSETEPKEEIVDEPRIVNGKFVLSESECREEIKKLISSESNLKGYSFNSDGLICKNGKEIGIIGTGDDIELLFDGSLVFGDIIPFVSAACMVIDTSLTYSDAEEIASPLVTNCIFGENISQNGIKYSSASVQGYVVINIEPEK